MPSHRRPVRPPAESRPAASSRPGLPDAQAISGSPYPKRSRNRPKISDVALKAGVSIGTVSAVLNSNGRVSEQTRRHVREVIADLGYRPDLYARNIARRETRVLGVIVSDLQNPFFAETAQAIKEEAARHGYQISLMSTNYSPGEHRIAIEQLLGARLAGLAVLTSEDNKVSRAMVHASDIPAIFLDLGRAQGNTSTLQVNARKGMELAVQHLVSLGHRDLLYVQNSRGDQGPALISHKWRNQGFAAAVRAAAPHGVRAHVIDMQGPGAQAGRLAIESAFGKGPFTAVVATTDMVALGVYRGLQSLGLRVPEDVSVIGFDNIEISDFLNPPLTTIDISRTEMSKAIVSTLLRSPNPGVKIGIETRLIERSSTAPSVGSPR